MTRCVFVPTLVDAANMNPQVGNVREILARWDAPDWHFRTLAYGDADPRVLANPHVSVTRLWRRHLWLCHVFVNYLRRTDVLFYPAVHAVDFAGLKWSRRLGNKPVVITTLEGLVGNAQREAEYSQWAGHPVYCQPVPSPVLDAIEGRNAEADHIIAISPFLARMGKARYGDRISMLPLGINGEWFFHVQRPANARLKVVGAGGVRAHKRPQLMLELARHHRHCDFIWYGEGELRHSLQQQAYTEGLTNLRFPGALPPPALGDAFRQADLFVLPSKSEGVPKVTQEAAACGLAQVVFGYYEAPSVIDGVNGFVAWDDAQWLARVAELIDDTALRQRFGAAGAERALGWHWQQVARQWQQAIIELVDRS